MKKKIYIALAMFLILELSFLVHGLLEVWYIKRTLTAGQVLDSTNFLGMFYCVLPAWLNYGLLLIALGGGFLLGRFWWRVVYIEHRHWHKFRKSSSQSLK